MVHQYRLNGFNIVLDTNSGSVHVVDEVAYDLIAAYPHQGREELIAGLLAKYAQRPDVTRAELEQCVRDVEALRDIDLEIQDGEIFGIIGLSGAGKSTLVRCINMLERPTEGSVLLDGRDLQAAQRRRGEGPLPPCGPYLQLKLRLLLRQPGALPRGAGADAL